MDRDQRHCLPNRIRTIIGLLSTPAGYASVTPLIEDGCRYAAQHPCPLWDACQSIYRAFRPDVQGRA